MTKMRVVCRDADIGYERYQGCAGWLQQAELPSLITVFHVDQGSGSVGIDIKEPPKWHFEKEAAEDPLVEAARYLPEEGTKPSRTNGLMVSGKVIPWGAAVRVLKSPFQGLLGCLGSIQPPSRSASPEAIAAFVCNSLTTEIDRGSAWQFEQLVLGQRPSEEYNAQSFATDLDLAVNYVRSVAMEERSASEAQPHLPPGTPMRTSIARVCDALVLRKLDFYTQSLDEVLADARAMLIAKNLAYGNSALDPVRVFSNASLKEQLLVRLDDKVSRLVRGQAAGEDVPRDMLGYLLLVAIAEKREREAT